MDVAQTELAPETVAPDVWGLDFSRVEAAIRFLDAHAEAQPRLADVAAHVGLSEHHFQRMFRRWAGVSPKRFLQFVTASHARTLLEGSAPLLEVAYESGLSGPGRLHDLVVNVHAMTPGELRGRGAGLTLRHGVHATPFGRCLLAATARGVCALSFVEPGREAAELAALAERWSAARMVEDDEATGTLVVRIFGGRTAATDPALHSPASAGASSLREQPRTTPAVASMGTSSLRERPRTTSAGAHTGASSPGEADASAPRALSLHVAGTNFQLRVWEALLRIPPGAVSTYGAIARELGLANGARAVGGAVAANPVGYLIPCHRVIRGTAAFGEYRWGAARKRAMLGLESVRAAGERGFSGE